MSLSDNCYQKLVQTLWHMCVQILPFLALGLGMDDMFLITHTFSLLADKPHVDSHVSVNCCYVTLLLLIITAFGELSVSGNCSGAPPGQSISAKGLVGVLCQLLLLKIVVLALNNSL